MILFNYMYLRDIEQFAKIEIMAFIILISRKNALIKMY